MRADVIPLGTSGDTINVYTSSAGDVPTGQETWDLVGTTFIDALNAFEKDKDTKAVVLVGEIGGTAEEDAWHERIFV